MVLEFKDILNKHKGKPCLVLAHGPSLNNFIPYLQKFRDKGFIIIGCNFWYNFYPEVLPDYWVLANNEITIENHIDKINEYRVPVVYADSVDFTNRDWISENIEVDYLPYDQRHTWSIPCGDTHCNCSEVIVPGRKTIQEELMSFTGTEEDYGAGDTVALHMSSLAVLLGCNRIYIVGVHIDYHLGYAHNNVGASVKEDEFDGFKDRVIRAFSIINGISSNVWSELMLVEGSLVSTSFRNFSINEIPEYLANIKEYPMVIHCIGDSHVCVFSGKDEICNDSFMYFRPLRIGAFLAHNLSNEDHAVNKEINNLIEKVGPDDYLMLSFGEVDIRVHIVKQAEKQGITINEVIEGIVGNYIIAIDRLISRGIKVIVWCPPPTCNHYGENAQVSEENPYPHIGTPEQRNMASIYFRDLLRNYYGESILILDLYDELIDENYLSRDEYFTDSVHLSQNAIPLILDKLKVLDI